MRSAVAHRSSAPASFRSGERCVCTCARKHCTRLCKPPAHTFRSQHCNHHHYHTACLGREIGRTWASRGGGPRDCSPRCLVFTSCFCRRAALAVYLYLSRCVCVCMHVCVRACLFVVVSARVSCVTELFSLLPNLCLLPPQTAHTGHARLHTHVVLQAPSMPATLTSSPPTHRRRCTRRQPTSTRRRASTT